MFVKIFPLLGLGIGIFLLIQVIMPIFSYKILEISLHNQSLALTNPLPGGQDVLGISVESNNQFPAIISTNYRSTKAPYDEFFLTIPSIKLEQAKVLVESNEFDKNLAHLPGSALPGERGNVFITGHSSLSKFFGQDKYQAIFTNLSQLKEGDKILIEAQGQQFEYLVENLKIVDPKQVSVINPPNNEGRYLSLMTCVPPGLYLKRLIVLAKLNSF